MKANINQVAFLIGESGNKEKAEIMMLEVIHGKSKIAANFGMNPKIEVDVDDFHSVHNIDLRMAMTDLYDNALKRSAFKKYLFREIPEEKLNKKLKPGEIPPKKIGLPRTLKTLLSQETLDAIQEYWDKNFTGREYKNYRERKYYPVFKV